MLNPGQIHKIADLVAQMTLTQLCELTQLIAAGASWGEILKFLMH